ncbi:MAG: hypothetical protein ACQEUY_09745 [Pseudomonadota bacterium]
MNVAVVFHSASGSTKQLVQAVAAGAAAQPEVDAIQTEIAGVDIAEGRFAIQNRCSN